MYNSFTTAIVRFIAVGVLAAGVWGEALAADAIKITKLEPTVFFPKVKTGEPLRQLARLGIENQGAAVEAKVKITMPGTPAYEESLGQVGTGASVKTIHVPDIGQPAELTVELYRQDGPQPADGKKVPWQPQRKWKIYCVSYSHQDLGYGDYPHRLRTNIRHANIERPLQFCRETDSWDDDSKFRFMIETSEPITSFLGSHGEATADELARRIREGRLQIGGRAEHGQHRATQPRVLGPAVLSDQSAQPRPAGYSRQQDSPDRRRHGPDVAAGHFLPRGRRALLLSWAQRLWPMSAARRRRAGILLARTGRPEQDSRPQHDVRRLMPATPSATAAKRTSRRQFSSLPAPMALRRHVAPRGNGFPIGDDGDGQARSTPGTPDGPIRG